MSGTITVRISITLDRAQKTDPSWIVLAGEENSGMKFGTKYAIHVLNYHSIYQMDGGLIQNIVNNKLDNYCEVNGS